jgi:hypothetical protein
MQIENRYLRNVFHATPDMPKVRPCPIHIAAPAPKGRHRLARAVRPRKNPTCSAAPQRRANRVVVQTPFAPAFRDEGPVSIAAWSTLLRRRLSAPKARHRLARSVRAGTPDPARTLSAGSATRRVQNPPKTRTANSFFVQAAAIACGFASKVMEQSGLTAVVGRLEYVTYNGSRLSRTDAEEQERRLCARAGT